MTKVTETWDQGKTEISAFTNMYYELIKMFKHFGSAIGIAFKDINDKANTMVGNQKNFTSVWNICDINSP
jgi:hypothetical protein